MPMNRRQVIEAARDGLIAQGDWALNPEKNACMYKNDEDKRCAIGVLPGFPEELGKTRKSAAYLFNEDQFNLLFDKDVTTDFLFLVQRRLHDDHALELSRGQVWLPFKPFDPELVRESAQKLLESLNA